MKKVVKIIKGDAYCFFQINKEIRRAHKEENEINGEAFNVINMQDR